MSEATPVASASEDAGDNSHPPTCDAWFKVNIEEVNIPILNSSSSSPVQVKDIDVDIDEVNLPCLNSSSSSPVQRRQKADDIEAVNPLSLNSSRSSPVQTSYRDIVIEPVNVPFSNSPSSSPAKMRQRNVDIEEVNTPSSSSPSTPVWKMRQRNEVNSHSFAASSLSSVQVRDDINVDNDENIPSIDHSSNSSGPYVRRKGTNREPAEQQRINARRLKAAWCGIGVLVFIIVTVTIMYTVLSMELSDNRKMAQNTTQEKWTPPL